MLCSGLDATPWRDHAKLVVVTPDGLALGASLATLLGALTNMSVQSWADFSARLPDEGAAGQQGGAEQVGGGRRGCRVLRGAAMLRMPCCARSGRCITT